MIHSLVQRLGQRNPDDLFEKLDPRAKLIALIVVTTAASIEREALLGLYVAVALLGLFSGLWKALFLSTACGAVIWLGVMKLLVPVTGEALEDPQMLFAGLVFRLSVITVSSIWFATKTNLYDFSNSLEKWRLPVWISLPFVINMRFLPTLMLEFMAVRDAMRQRGIYCGLLGAIRQPSTTFRYFITPMLIRSLRMADELTAAAESRGIGRLDKRSYYRNTAFSLREAAFLASVALVVIGNSLLFRMLDIRVLSVVF